MRSLQLAFLWGKRAVPRFMMKETTEKELERAFPESFIERSNGHRGRQHLMNAFFLAGMSIEINEAIQRAQEPHDGITPLFNREGPLKNLFLSAALANRELILAQIQCTPEDNTFMGALARRITELPYRWWIAHFSGALAVGRLAAFLIAEGYKVYLPFLNEDVEWKIDLIARHSGDPFGICFQVKGSEAVEWVECRALGQELGPHSDDMTRRFWNGVRAFQHTTHGLYVPVELTLGSQHFQQGQIIAKGHIIDALRDGLTRALLSYQEPSMAASH
ncbi:hypothetical protein HZA85_01505 [Candidatus Uhrbacteria bacterium]|nr:hypothetical protein [Candidatus Uhrbacteria bacterium]